MYVQVYTIICEGATTQLEQLHSASICTCIWSCVVLTAEQNSNYAFRGMLQAPQFCVVEYSMNSSEFLKLLSLRMSCTLVLLLCEISRCIQFSHS